MNIVLLSGGSGKRLWPLSNDTMSKQFLSLLPSPDGGMESMVQRVYRQIKQADKNANIVIAANKTQVAIIKKQIGDVDVVIEPERRNTYPAILLACAYMKFKKKSQKDDVIIVLPIDVFADETYFMNLYLIEKAIKEQKANLMLMGAKPTYPSEKYGYIIPVEYKQNAVMSVKEFKEKPNLDKAKQLVNEGAIWNCGVFGFKLAYIMEILKNEYNAACFEDIQSNYSALTKDSFDYKVIEKEQSIGLIEYTGVWKDLGTWNTLVEEMGTQNIGERICISESCKNTNVLNMLDLPIITMGVENAVIVASHDGILVSSKQQSSYLKPYSDLIVQRPMYEQRSWGNYRVIDYAVNDDGNCSITKKLKINKNMSLSYHFHIKRTEIWTIISGEGAVMLEDKTLYVNKGETVTIMPTQKHALKAFTEIELIEVQIGEVKFQGDTVKLNCDW